MNRRSAPRAATAVAVLAALVLTIAGCGSSGSSPGEGATTATAGSTDVTLAADGPPQSGGSLAYALSSESDGFDPTQNRWAGDGTQVAQAIFDPLAAYDADGNTRPYLAESFTPDATFTTWTVRLRDGVLFQDGTPLTAAAVKTTMDRHLASALTAKTFALLERVDAPDARTVVFTMKAPWAAFPSSLTGQAGMIPAPAQLADPNGSRNPIGTGPFRFVEWVPDSRLVVERNPGYWRRDADGTRLPYLDRVEFRPIPDDQSRANAVASGAVDMSWTTAVPTLLQWQKMAREGQLQLVEQHGQTEVTFVMLNLAAPPFDDPLARQAVAHATDRQTWVDVLAQGQTTPAKGIYRPGSPWYTETAYPTFDLEQARRDVAAYEAAHGPLSFSISALSTDIGRQQAELLKQMWEQADMHVDVRQTEASTFILDSVMGNYQSAVWGQFGSPDPDYEQVWWYGDNAAPVGQIALNFPRHQDVQTDAALREARPSDDPAARAPAYATVQQRLAEDLPYIWLDHPRPTVVAQNTVRGITNGPLPDGAPSMPMGGPGSFSYVTRLTQTWRTP